MANKKYSFVLVALISVLLGLLAGAIIMLVSGYNPINGYAALWEGAFGDLYFTGETLRRITPLILAGLAVGFAFRTGLFNIGVEGQVIVGWLAAIWAGTAFELPTLIHLPFAILVAALAGAFWGFIPGLLKAKLHVHEVIVTIMLNYTALYIANHVIRTLLTDGKDSTPYVAESASLRTEWLTNLTQFSSMHLGIIIAVFGAFVMWFLLERTTQGYELRSVGFNQHASKYAGMKVDRKIILSMVISGAFAGVAGAMEGLGTFQHMYVMSGFTNIGFDGIAVALLGGNAGLGIVFAAGLFGTLKAGALNMPLEAGVPSELVDIVIALIIFFVAGSYMIRWILSRFQKEGK
ncbi:simple sugar transport system permease protein [Salirhabdus euzebyi]|uniref:Simple sugar transport system permease protein n=1 Tax=Salirhabdus euzebyi TaxID=394506 RepID=A0A841Q396_9BACI|nr:ABC transporter permease [Salirhabdus euzebyi]MBB6452861.1 simple sugar transport system permease protein [Salirhabdus euzebyi]